MYKKNPRKNCIKMYLCDSDKEFLYNIAKENGVSVSRYLKTVLYAHFSGKLLKDNSFTLYSARN
jgi:hypothetical protein